MNYLCSIIVLLYVTALVQCGLLEDEDVRRIKRFNDEDDDSTLIICNGGHLTATCPAGSSVNVTIAEYGRTSEQSICAKAGMDKNEICLSLDALDRIQKFCRAKTFCTMEVNANNLGRPVTSDGSSCFETSKYLKLTYSCISDCQPPVFTYNSEVIGEKYHVGSTVMVHCRAGYERVDKMRGGVKKTCEAGRGWIGLTLLCQDMDECENPSSNQCHKFATCQNTRGSYSCTCIEGYHGDGISCTSDSWFQDDDWSMPGSSVSSNEDESWDEALIEVHDEKICGKRIIRSRQGILKSPGSPLNYPSRTSCVWIIAVPPGLVVQLRFMKFDLEREQRGEGCSRDNVTLYEGLNRDSKWWLGTFCGDVTPAPITSQKNQIRIEFRSDETAEFSGFEARFYAIDLNSACLNFPAAYYSGIRIANGTRNSTTQPRQSLELGCENGYIVTPQSLVRTCQDDGKWDDDSNPCSPVSCGTPYIPFDAEGLNIKAESSRFRYGELPVRYHCDIGYRKHIPQGSDDVILCDKNGKWSNSVHKVTPWCEEIMCVCEAEVTCAKNEGDGASHKALNWIVTDADGMEILQPVGQKMAYGSQIRYSCDEGYTLAGDDVRFCTDDGWSGRRTTCDAVEPPGLSNYHVAVIASASSGFIILIITIALVICCCRDHQKKKNKRKQLRHRRTRGARDNDGFVMNMAMTGSDDFLYGNTIDRRGRNKGFAGRHNDIRKYQTRPHVLPTSGVMPSPNTNYHNRPRPDKSTRPQDSPVRNGNHIRSTSVTKINTKAPPPGYQDPPPSYETMEREGYSNRQFTPNKKRNRRR